MQASNFIKNETGTGVSIWILRKLWEHLFTEHLWSTAFLLALGKQNSESLRGSINLLQNYLFCMDVYTCDEISWSDWLAYLLVFTNVVSLHYCLNETRITRDHIVSTCVKLLSLLNYAILVLLYPWHVRAHIRGWEMLVFWKDFG